MTIRGAVLALLLGLPALAQTCSSIALSSPGIIASGAGTSGFFTAAGTPSSCTKTVSSSVPWITISFGGGGSEPSTIGYTVQRNSSTNPRFGTISVNNGLATFSVTQSGISCSYSLSPATATVSADGGSGTATVSTSAECPWTASANVPWITVNGAGSGNGSLSYSVQPNTTREARTGTITAGSDTLVITQQPACGFTLSPSFQQIRASAETGTVTITATSSACVRNAVSDSAWLTIPVGSTGTGNGTLSWTAAANNTPTTRTGRITVGDATFTLEQAGGSCTYALNPAAQRFTALGGAGTFTVNTACQWTASTSANWLTVTSAASGAGTSTLAFRADPNPSPAERTGSILVGTEAFLVTQDGAACNLKISSTSLDVPATGGTGSFEIDVVSGCAWTAVSSVPWITFTSAASGSTDTTLSFAVAANTTPGARTGTITVGNRQFTVNQAGANCELSLNPTANTAVPSNAFQGAIAVTSTCQWTAQSTVPWVTLTAGAAGTGNGQIEYSIPANPSASSRSGAIRVGNLTFNIVQTGGGCTVSINPQRGTFPGGAATGRFSVNGSLGCQWTPATSEAWITIDGFSSVNGAGAVDFTLTPNFTGAERSGAIRVADGVSYTVIQDRARPTIVSGGLLNGASFRAGPIAPGTILTLYGTLMGPADLKTLELTADRGGIADTLAGTRVLFDGIPAPVLYTSDKQLSAIAPYELQGRATAKVKVEYLGAASDEAEIVVAPASPAIFTQNASGAGAAAVLNQDNSLNTASNAAQRGSIIQIFATGGGQTNPPSQTGRLAAAPVPQYPAGRVTVRIGNLDAPVVYAGAAPGLVNGLMQINVRVPPNAPLGAAVPIVLRVNNVDSPAGVTLAVRQ